MLQSDRITRAAQDQKKKSHRGALLVGGHNKGTRARESLRKAKQRVPHRAPAMVCFAHLFADHVAGRWCKHCWRRESRVD
jgi:hypothetical protein